MKTLPLTIESTDVVAACCRSLVPGADVMVEPLDVRVRCGSMSFRAYWWTGKGEANWAYQVTGGECEDEGPLEDREGLTHEIYEAFGARVLPAVLIEVLVADGRPCDGDRVMDVARKIVARSKPGEVHPRDTLLRAQLHAAMDARDLHIATSVMLDAVAIVAPIKGHGWVREAIRD